MNPFRRSRPSTADLPWVDTLPSVPPAELPPGRANGLPLVSEVLDGLDVHELESQTVFDQFFGPDASIRG
jgi:hypothetical protein